jgi:hypothetical protein
LSGPSRVHPRATRPMPNCAGTAVGTFPSSSHERSPRVPRPEQLRPSGIPTRGHHAVDRNPPLASNSVPSGAIVLVGPILVRARPQHILVRARPQHILVRARPQHILVRARPEHILVGASRVPRTARDLGRPVDRQQRIRGQSLTSTLRGLRHQAARRSREIPCPWRAARNNSAPMEFRVTSMRRTDPQQRRHGA